MSCQQASARLRGRGGRTRRVGEEAGRRVGQPLGLHGQRMLADEVLLRRLGGLGGALRVWVWVGR